MIIEYEGLIPSDKDYFGPLTTWLTPCVDPRVGSQQHHLITYPFPTINRYIIEGLKQGGAEGNFIPFPLPLIIILNLLCALSFVLTFSF